MSSKSEHILQEILSEKLIEYDLKDLKELDITKLVDLFIKNGYNVIRPIVGNRKRISIIWTIPLQNNKRK